MPRHAPAPGPWAVKATTGITSGVMDANGDTLFISAIPKSAETRTNPKRGEAPNSLKYADRVQPIWDEIKHTILANERLAAAAPDLLELVTLALPYVEDATNDPAYDPGVVRGLANRITTLIEQIEKDGAA
jgi:hypothetical protein